MRKTTTNLDVWFNKCREKTTNKTKLNKNIHEKKLILKYLLLLIIITLISACSEPNSTANYERQLNESKEKNEQLVMKNNELIEENTQLREKVVAQASNLPGGMIVEEERKALSKRKADLETAELKLAGKNEKLKRREEFVLQKEAQFF